MAERLEISIPVCAALALAALLAALVVAPVSRAPAASVSSSRMVARSAAAPKHFRFFSAASFWNRRTASGTPLDPSSPQVMQAFRAELKREQRAGEGPWIGTTSYSVPIYQVGSDQPTVRVRLDSPHAAAALREAFAAVPLPPGARPSPGSDGHLVLWQPSSDRLWEFWRLEQGPDGPQASWGGAIRGVSSSPGVYGPRAWPGATRWWGAPATSLSLAGGVITLEDLRRGEINHALAMTIPAVRSGVYSAPARRGDGRSANPLALPEGAHLRLDPDLDIASLHLPRATRLIAEAAQRYGIFIRDGASVVKFIAQDPVTVPGNPYKGREGFFEGRYPGQLLAAFPWEHLQLLKLDLHGEG